MEKVFVDETKSSSLVFAASIVPDARAKSVRADLRKLLLRGQRSIHFAKESDRRRKQILSIISTLEIPTHIFDTGLKPSGASREFGLLALLDHLKPSNICLELDVSSLQRDQVVLSNFENLACAQQREFRYGFEIPSREPLLWLPDLFAWCYQRGGDYKKAFDSPNVVVYKL